MAFMAVMAFMAFMAFIAFGMFFAVLELLLSLTWQGTIEHLDRSRLRL